MGRLAVRTPVGFSGLGARLLVPNAGLHPTKKSVELAASAEQGRNREDPQSKRFWQLLGTSPRSTQG